MTFNNYAILSRILFAGHSSGTATTNNWSRQLALRQLRCHLNVQAGRQQGRDLMWKRNLTTQVPRPYVDPKYSYAYGKSQEHLIYSTVSRELDSQLQQRPDDVAFISHSEKIKKTYRQFTDDVNKVVKTMVTKFGVGRGDFVSVFAYNCYNWLLVEYACTRIGAILSPINPSYKADELAFIIKQGKVKCLFMPGPKSIQSELNDHMGLMNSPAVVDLFASEPKPLLENVILFDGENHYQQDYLDNLKLAKYCKFHDWSITQSTDGQVFKSTREAEAAGVHLDEACVLDLNLVSPDDLFAVYYTSGTTGKPKGACCTQFTVLNNVRMCQIRLRNMRPRNWKVVLATTLPMFHIFAGVLNALTPVVGNTAVVLTSHKYDIATYVESIFEHQANVTTLTPTMLIDMLTYVRQTKKHDIPLKSIQPGGAQLSPELVSQCFKTFTQLEEVRTGYGSTENGSVSTFQTIHEPETTRAYTVGPPLDFTEVRVVDPHNDGLIVPLGVQGEIQTRGYNTMLEYLDQPDKTNEVITPHRWYRTGDIGFMHPHGSLEISGRLKHMIIKGGENIYPEEVEKMMYKLDCIEKVHVIGVPDKRFGEQVCAWIKLKPGYKSSGGDFDETSIASSNETANEVTKDDILEFCKENMTYFKVPKYVFFVQDFPMTPTKKVQNHRMIERSIKILELDTTQS